MRAYLRLDPNLPDHKSSYPDGALAAFVLTLCLAEQQPTRGVFKNRKLLAVLLERRSRWIRYLIDHDDLVEREDGKLYVDGWSEWQEGDHTVPDRMRRLRNRKAGAVTPGVTPAVTVGVTGEVTPTGVSALSSGGGKRLAEAEAGGSNEPGARFMGWPPKASASGGVRPAPLHDGRHGSACAVCAPLVPPPGEAKTNGGSVEDARPATSGTAAGASPPLDEEGRATAIAELRLLAGDPSKPGGVIRAALRQLERLEPDTDWPAELAAAGRKGRARPGSTPERSGDE